MSTGSVSPLALLVLLEETQNIFFDIWWDWLRQTNCSSLLGKILTNKKLIYLYLNFVVICKSLIVMLSKSIMFNVFLYSAICWSHSVIMILVYS